MTVRRVSAALRGRHAGDALSCPDESARERNWSLYVLIDRVLKAWCERLAVPGAIA
jgi:hypothetical protein